MKTARAFVTVQTFLTGVAIAMGGGCAGDAGGDVAEDVVQSGTDVPDVPDRHPLLLAADTGACAPTICAADGDPYGDMKAFYQANGFCADLPSDLDCRVKSQMQGVAWPDAVDAAIEAASTTAGGFTDAQKAALRCLAYLEPSGEFGVRGGDAGSRTPSSVTLNLAMRIDGDAEQVAATFLQRLGPLLGAAFGVTPDYSLETRVTSYSGYAGASGAVEVRVLASSYKGVMLRDPVTLQAVLQPVSGSGGSGDDVCPGVFRLDSGIENRFDRRLEDARLGLEGRIAVDEAVGKALALCGATCWALPDPRAEWRLATGGLEVQLTLGCPSHCDAYPDWTCTYHLDAYTGAVLSGGEDCCVDCIG